MTALSFDVHAHFVLDPSGGTRNVQTMGAQWDNFKGPPPTAGWSPEAALAFMDERGIAMQLLSIPVAPDAETARAANDQAARIVAAHPHRFGLLAALPMAHPEAALEEVRRASEDLGADGFVLVSNYDGLYLGNDVFGPVLEELHRREASVFLHPINPLDSDHLCLGRPGPIVEFPMDTARTIVDALFAGVFLRHSGMRMVVSHGGGALPALSARILALGSRSFTPNPLQLTSERLREQMSSLYLDTAIAGDPVALVPALQLVGPEHLVFGTDYPPAGTEVIDATRDALRSGEVLTSDAVAQLDRTFAFLFPRAVSRAGTGA